VELIEKRVELATTGGRVRTRSLNRALPTPDDDLQIQVAQALQVGIEVAAEHAQPIDVPDPTRFCVVRPGTLKHTV